MLGFGAPSPIGVTASVRAAIAPNLLVTAGRLSAFEGDVGRHGAILTRAWNIGTGKAEAGTAIYRLGSGGPRFASLRNLGVPSPARECSAP